MAGPESNHFKDESGEKQIKDGQRADKDLAKLDAKLRADSQPEQNLVQARPGDATVTSPEAISVTAQRAMASLQRLTDAMTTHPELMGALLDSCAGVPQFEQTLIESLKQPTDAAEKARQQDLFAMIQSALKDSTKSA